MGSHPSGRQRFADDAVVSPDKRMLSAEAVLSYFWTHHFARANPQASFATCAAKPNTDCSQPCARTVVLAAVERRLGGEPRRAASKSRHGGRNPVRALPTVRAESLRFCGDISFGSLRRQRQRYYGLRGSRLPFGEREPGYDSAIGYDARPC